MDRVAMHVEYYSNRGLAGMVVKIADRDVSGATLLIIPLSFVNLRCNRLTKLDRV
jgi:hypothetical protein